MTRGRSRAWVALLAGAGLAGGSCARLAVTEQEVARSEVLHTHPLSEVLLHEGPSDLEFLTGRVMSTTTSALGALERGQVAEAREHLEEAVEHMELLYSRLPGEPFLGDVDTALARLGAGQATDLMPLLERARERQEVLGEETLELLEGATVREQAEDLVGAAQELREARELLAEDLLLFPLDEARSHLLMARNALRVGNEGRARVQLARVPGLLEHVRATEPLVKVRWQLRAAAAAAERGDWIRARKMLAVTERRLREYRGGPEDPLTGTIALLRADIRLLLEQMRGRERPSPEVIRQLAHRTLPAPVG
jgi:hypothetical protein